MTSGSSFDAIHNVRTGVKVVCFENSYSEESMSIHPEDADLFEEGNGFEETETGSVPYWRVKWTSEKEPLSSERSRGNARSKSAQRRCLRCEAYDVHCKSAAENYHRILTSYTKTVSELMIGFKKVLEKYPELRVDSSDEHLHYMVQSALGRNNLVQEMVRLSTMRHARVSQQVERETDQCVITMQEAHVPVTATLSG